MPAQPTLVLTAADVERLLDLDRCIAAVEEAFRLYGAGQADPPAVLGVHAAGGGFHVKAGLLPLGRSYFAAKCNANFPENPAKRGLPTIQGLVILADATDGTPLAVMESGVLTALRTAAASAVAAKYLSRAGSETMTIVGCGVQGYAHLRALCRARPIRRAFAVDRSDDAARRFARAMGSELGIDVRACTDLRDATRASDIVVTCTSSREAFLGPEHVSPGAFVAAVGADNPEKSEMRPELMRAAAVIPDLLGQAMAMGDLHHAIEAKTMSASDVRCELGAVVAGRHAGRSREDEIVVFDSTGMALQDVAAAAVVYERAAGERVSVGANGGLGIGLRGSPGR